MLMESQKIVEFFNERLDLCISMPRPRKFMQKWRDLAERCAQAIFLRLVLHFFYSRNDNLQKEVHIALVGKYTQLEDSYASVTKALQHSAIASGYRLKLKVIALCSFYLDQDYQAREFKLICKFKGISTEN